MAFLTIEKKRGIWFSIHLIFFGISFHWCKHCSKLAIEILNTQFLWDWSKYEEVEKPNIEFKDIIMPTEEELVFMKFDNNMNQHNYFMFTTYLSGPEQREKIHKWINEEEHIISISFSGAVNVIKSETFEGFINSKLKKPEND